MKKHSKQFGYLALSLGLLLVAGYLVKSGPAFAAPPGTTFTVNSVNDGSDDSTGDGICETSTPGECTLRAAIEQANTNSNPSQQDIIEFGISGAGVHTIQRGGNHYSISQNVLIDGFTQGGTPNTTTSPAAFDADLLIEVDSTNGNVGTVTFNLSGAASGSTIKGLVMNHGRDAQIATNSVDDISVVGNYIGTDPTGLIHEEDVSGGLAEGGGGSNFQIGGTDPADRNIVTAHLQSYFSDAAIGTVIEGNYFDVGSDGIAGLVHTTTPTIVFSGGNGARIGGATVAAKNIINNSPSNAVQLRDTTHDTVVEGNEIMDNNGAGVLIENGSYNITVGGAAPSALNQLSSNLQGVVVTGTGTHDITIQNNFIGTDLAGTTALGNSTEGIIVQDASAVSVLANVIADSGSDGVLMTNADDGIISDNFIGTDAGDTLNLGGQADGISLDTCTGTSIAGNTIVNNANMGIELFDSINVTISDNRVSGNSNVAINLDNTSASSISGNLIGTNAAGTASETNAGGVALSNSSSNNIIGGTLTADRNVISGNTTAMAVTIQDSGTDNNTVIGNYIGVNAAGTGVLPNTMGVMILGGPSQNTIGGTTASERNVISGNSTYNSVVYASDNNTISGNYIGTNAAGTASFADSTGVVIGVGSGNTVGGTSAGARNVISGHSVAGLQVTGDNVVIGNYIGTNAAGSGALPNGLGVQIIGSGITLGGPTSASRNVISGNTNAGVFVAGGMGTPTTGVTIQNNYIGTDPSGNNAAWNTQAIGVDLVGDVNDSMIGGASPSVGNLIQGNDLAGVILTDFAGTYQPAHNPIIGNSIFDNNGNNIDLCLDSDSNFMCESLVGSTPNDAGDPDAGANQLENTPIVTAASYNGAAASATFDLDAGDSPGGQYHIEFFASDASSEGKTYLGFANVGNGNNQTVNSLIVPNGYDMSGKYISATTTQFDDSFSTTDGYGATSEFSAGIIPTNLTSGVTQTTTLPLSDTGQNNLRPIIAALTLIMLGVIGLVLRRKLKPSH